MSRNEGPASVPTAPYTVTEGVFQLAATTEYYKNEIKSEQKEPVKYDKKDFPALGSK